MDDASLSSLKNLKALGEHTAKAFRQELDEIVDTLINAKKTELIFN